MFFKRADKFNKKLNNHIKSMVEISFEYVGWNEKEIDKIYIFCSTEESYFFSFFYAIKGEIVDRHLVNDHLDKKCNVDPSQQEAADDVGMEDLLSLAALFKKFNKDVPTIMKITYDTRSSKMDTDFSYEKRLIGTDLMPIDLLDEWIEELK